MPGTPEHGPLPQPVEPVFGPPLPGSEAAAAPSHLTPEQLEEISQISQAREAQQREAEARRLAGVAPTPITEAYGAKNSDEARLSLSGIKKAVSNGLQRVKNTRSKVGATTKSSEVDNTVWGDISNRPANGPVIPTKTRAVQSAIWRSYVDTRNRLSEFFDANEHANRRKIGYGAVMFAGGLVVGFLASKGMSSGSESHLHHTAPSVTPHLPKHPRPQTHIKTSHSPHPNKQVQASETPHVSKDFLEKDTYVIAQRIKPGKSTQVMDKALAQFKPTKGYSLQPVNGTTEIVNKQGQIISPHLMFRLNQFMWEHLQSLRRIRKR